MTYSNNQEYAENYIHHSTEPLGLNSGANVDEAAPADGAVPASGTQNTNISDATRYAPENADVDAGYPKYEPGATGMELSPEVESAFRGILYPEDSFNSSGTYWADLPFREQWKFVQRTQNKEARRELGVMWRMFKADPFSLIREYFATYVLNGMGMFVEGYTLFSVGNVKKLFEATEGDFKRCWKDHSICDEDWIYAINYLEIVGIIVGQVAVGVEGDWVGRRFGMVQDALIMTLGSVMLTCMWGLSMNGWVICYAWSLFIYGFGVGGEYPMTSTRAMEAKADPYAASTGDRLHRGRNVLMAFLMQGWGQFFNQFILILLLLIFHGGTMMGTITRNATQFTFRVSFGIIAFVTLFLAYYRYYKMSYSDQSLQDAKARLNTSGYDAKSFKLACSHYWHRLFASTVGWFCNDFFFYGNKIFSGVFISIITGSGGKLQVTWLYNLINVGVQLPGYYLAAFLVDNKFYGRRFMQAFAFFAMFALFVSATFAWGHLTSENRPKNMGELKAFQFIYFFSSFWNQFGFNSTTFLVAAEIFPASIRATCHGIGAAWGKLGALIPTIIYNYVGDHVKFYIVTWFGLAGLAVTVIFLPDTTGLDLREQERYWEYVMNGRAEDYHGVAVHPRHLSLFEIYVLRRHLPYNPQLDAEQKTEEFRRIYNSTLDSYGRGDKDMTEQQREFIESEFGNKFIKETRLNNSHGEMNPSKLSGFEKELNA